MDFISIPYNSLNNNKEQRLIKNNKLIKKNIKKYKIIGQRYLHIKNY